MRSALVALVLIWLGCGSSSGDTSVCDSLATAASDFSTKAAPCFSTLPPLQFSGDACRASISKCTDSDQQKLRDFTSCLQALPTCAPATLQAWTTSLDACQAKLGGLAGQGGC
ncbi:MAG TPA: hypothetical protein VLT82_19570 [Myxococcaceae bacterium]|nr:hypothetical protein [Myxococcaceae bacterium]